MPLHRHLGSVLWLAVCAIPTTAFALQPLAAFVQSARDHNPDNAEARAGFEAQDAQADASLGRVLPNGMARGSYTRNQYQIGPVGPLPPLLNESVYLQRYNQLDAFFTINVPLVDLASFERIGAARTNSKAAGKVEEATGLQVSAMVAQGFFQLVATQAVLSESLKAQDVARSDLQRSETRFETGKGNALDVDRAKAEVERQTQFVALARLQVALSARALESLSGMTPDTAASVSLEDDLHDEAALDTFVKPDSELPALAAASLGRQAAEQQADAQRFALLPTFSASGTEHGTNAASFIGVPWSYLGSLNLTWQIDYSTFANMRVLDASTAVARAREEKTRRAVHDSIHRAWETVGAAIARGRAARAEQLARTHAAELAAARYDAGAATQLDLVQAQRDAFAADVDRIQADADLANARLQLRLAAGIDPFRNGGTP